MITNWAGIYSLTVLEARGQENHGAGRVMLFQGLFGRLCPMTLSYFPRPEVLGLWLLWFLPHCHSSCCLCICSLLQRHRGFPSGSAVKNLPAVQETQEIQVGSLGWEDPLEEGMTTHSSSLSWRIPWIGRILAGYSPWSRKE